MAFRFRYFLPLGLALSPCLGQSTLDTIGVTALRNADATLTGANVIVIQVESAPSPLQFEVNPSATSQPPSLFSYRSTEGAALGFPNHVGSESGHADNVGQNLYGQSTGAAPGLRHVSVVETDYFVPNVISRFLPTTAKVINQSFESGPHSAGEDQVYDDYIATHRTLIFSGVGNGGPILSPSDCYNGIGVGLTNGGSSVGPTADGRCKPDLVAPESATSFSTPLASGAAALLIQAGRRLGVEAAAATDCRTVKALLLNGAVKPSGWSHSATVPLDYTYGAGVLNVFNSYEEMQGGRHGPVAAAAVLRAQNHPPLTSGNTTDPVRGWDLRALGSSPARDGVRHYRLNASGTFAATLVWNRQRNRAAINHLELFLYDSSGTQVASSVSTVDNVQHLYVTGLNSGTYDLEVVKPGGPGLVSPADGYALAWDASQ